MRPVAKIGGMKRYRSRKCKHCHELYKVNPRARERQEYCTKPDCRRASHAASQRRWASKPENHEFVSGPDEVKRVQAWRKANPGYWRRCYKRGRALRDLILSQPADSQEDAAGLIPDALHDLSSSQLPLLVGFISSLTDNALHDEIVETMRGYHTRGQLILGMVPGMKGQRGEGHG